MPGQGWAGSQPPIEKLLCGVCAQNSRSVTAITIISGTALCMEHVTWVNLPLHPRHA